MDVSLVVTYRDTELQQVVTPSPASSPTSTEANVTRLQLRGLEDIEVVELLAAAAGHDLDALVVWALPMHCAVRPMAIRSSPERCSATSGVRGNRHGRRWPLERQR